MGWIKSLTTIGSAAYVNALYAPVMTDTFVGRILPTARHDSFLGHNFADTPHFLTYTAATAVTALTVSYLWDAVRGSLKDYK